MTSSFTVLPLIISEDYLPYRYGGMPNIEDTIANKGTRQGVTQESKGNKSDKSLGVASHGELWLPEAHQFQLFLSRQNRKLAEVDLLSCLIKWWPWQQTTKSIEAWSGSALALLTYIPVSWRSQQVKRGLADNNTNEEVSSVVSAVFQAVRHSIRFPSNNLMR